MYGPWDAPIDLQRMLRDEGDPPPLEIVTVPNLVITAADDPDTSFRYSCAYAAQVMILDACWRTLMESVTARSPHEPWLVALVGARGFPLGEHRRIGGVDERLHAEQLHVPLLLRFPDGLGRLARSVALVSHMDVLPTLTAWIEGSETMDSPHIDGMSILPLVSNANALWRDAILSTSAKSVSFRTSAWCLRKSQSPSAMHEQTSDEHQAGELYVRPDDRWEANDVAKLCPDVVELLAGTVAQACQQLKQIKPMAV
jgi:arylsulfatase A-like enzyme